MTRDEILAVYAAGPEAVVQLVEQLLAIIARLEARVAELEAENAALRARVEALEQRLGQNSRNSHRPPSQDGFARPPRPRPPSNRSPGGQKGHPGHTLRMSEHPDRVIVHKATSCEKCGSSLEEVPARDYERRQVYDLPRLALTVTEHRAERKSCPYCGTVTKAAFPPEVTQPTQYGPRIRAVATYLSQYQLLPYERIEELFTDLFDHAISPATVVAANQALADHLARIEEATKEQIRQAPVVHCDETSIRIGGQLYWLHVASTATETIYAPHPKRGRPALDEMDILSGFAGTAVHDAWPPYFSYPEVRHALCNAHHLRELTALVEQGQGWAQEMIDLLTEIKQIVDQTRPRASRLEPTQCQVFERRYQEVLARGWKENPPLPDRQHAGQRGRPRKTRAQNLLERLEKYRPAVLAFMYDFRIPFDNNLVERDLRMVKVQQKISGTFRSFAGALAFSRIRGYISTVRKRGLPVLHALEAAFHGQPALTPLPDP